MIWSGFCGPICKRGEGYASVAAAKDAAIAKLLARFPKAWPSEPQSVHDELRGNAGPGRDGLV
jgi:hypothetical protein